jgi:DNA-binding NarL/FixJ family response regulator
MADVTPPAGSAGETDGAGDRLMRIVIVDDDPLVRAGLRMLLNGDGLTVVGEAEDGAEGQRLVADERPDVVLMDIRMPGVDGLTATEAILGGDDPPHVILLTTFDADEHIMRALRAGAAGFLLKDTPPADIVDAVHRVATGDAQLSPSITRRLIDTAVATRPDAVTAKELLAQLSERELTVARAVREGLSNNEIAARLYLSRATVKTYVSTLIAKLGVGNRVQVALIVRDAEEAP